MRHDAILVDSVTLCETMSDPYFALFGGDGKLLKPSRDAGMTNSAKLSDATLFSFTSFVANSCGF